MDSSAHIALNDDSFYYILNSTNRGCNLAPKKRKKKQTFKVSY